MGSKIARSNSSPAVHGVVSTGSTTSSKTVPPPPAKANPDDVFTNGSAKQDVIQDVAAGKDSAKPVALPFRSYQNGTLGNSKLQPFPPVQSRKTLLATTPAFVPVGAKATVKVGQKGTPPRGQGNTSQFSTPQKSGSSTSTSPGGLSGTTSPTTPSTPGSRDPLSTKPARVFLTRVDKTKKDVVITASAIRHNIVRIKEVYPPSSKPVRFYSQEFVPARYNLVDAIKKMESTEAAEFWQKNWVEIVIDLQDYETKEGDSTEPAKKPGSVVDMIEKLGPDFSTNIRTVFFTIHFPPSTTSAKKSPNFQTLTHTPGYHAIHAAVTKVRTFTSLQRLDVVLATPANTPSPVSLHQLAHALPFYELPFTRWGLKWQASYMTHAETIRGWPIAYLDREWVRERERVERELVFVRRSMRPEVSEFPFVARETMAPLPPVKEG